MTTATLNYDDPVALAEASMAWREHTMALRAEMMAEELAKAEAVIRKEREGKVKPENVYNRAQQTKAKNIASGAVLGRLYKLKAHDGMDNPVANDPVWGHNSEGAQEAKKAAQPTPNKYAGKCADCGGWVEANTGTIIKKAGKWYSQHIGECPPAAIRPNSYAGTCGHCGQNVKPNEGRIEKSNAGWLTFHLDGSCPEAAEATEDTQDGLDLSGLVPGYYAVPNGSRLKLAISHGKGKWEGFSFVKDASEYGAGKRYGMQRPEQTYRGQVETELAAILENPLEAMKAYGKLVGKCGACGRQLEDEASVEAGIGPICATKWEG